MLGDDHAWVAEASRLAQERIKCTIQPTSPFYRREGHTQARMRSIRADMCWALGVLPGLC